MPSTKKSPFVTPTLGAIPGPGMLHCNNCSHDNDPARSTCENCGDNLPGAVQVPGVAAQPTFSRRMGAVLQGKRWIFILLLVVVVLGTGVVLLWPTITSTFFVASSAVSAEQPATQESVEPITVMPGEEIPLDCGLTVIVPDLKETTEQTFHNPQTDCYTTVRWVINNP